MGWKKFALRRATVLQWVLSVESALGDYLRRQPCQVKKSLLDIRVVGYLAESFGRVELWNGIIPAKNA